MAKRIALLISLVMMLSFSCVFATETLVTETAPEAEVVDVVSGDVEVEAPVSGEEVEVEAPVSGEAEVEAPVSGEAEAPVSGEETVPAETEEGNGSVLAAVIAIVVVVAIVAIVCVLKKK